MLASSANNVVYVLWVVAVVGMIVLVVRRRPS